MPLATLRELFDNFYQPRKLIGTNPNTAVKFRIALKHFEKFCQIERVRLRLPPAEHAPTVDDLDDIRVESFIRWMADEAQGLGLSPHTANSYGSKISALWDLLGRKRLAHDRPSIKPMRAPRRKPIAWSNDELRKLLKSCTEQPGTYGNIPARTWWVVLHVVIMATGERINAVLQLEWSDYNPDRQTLTRRAETRKWKTQDLTTHLDTVTAAALECLRSPLNEKIFPFPHHRATLYNHYREILSRAGLPTDRKRYFHCLRKWSGSTVKAEGGDPQAQLGHQDQQTLSAYMVPEIVGTEFDTQALTKPFQILDLLNLKAG